MNQETTLLALLIFAIVATRPLEASRWRDGRLSDRAAAALLLGRLPLLLGGYALVTGLGVPVALLGVVIGLVPAALLFRWAERRLERRHAKVRARR